MALLFATSSPLPPTADPTVLRYRQVATAWAAELGATIFWQNRPPFGLGGAVFDDNKILTKPITDDLTFATAMHEIGHAKTYPCRADHPVVANVVTTMMPPQRVCVDCECAATEAAFVRMWQTGITVTPAMRQRLGENLRTYLPYAQNDAQRARVLMLIG
jgi:hypothetical protein